MIQKTPMTHTFFPGEIHGQPSMVHLSNHHSKQPQDQAQGFHLGGPSRRTVAIGS